MKRTTVTLLKIAVMIGATLWILTASAQTEAQTGTQAGENRGDRAWQHFSQRFDENEDGSVTQEELGEKMLGRLDGNDDGVLTEEDFEGRTFSHRRRGPHGAPILARLIHRADENRDRTVTAAEWQELLAALDADGDGVLDPRGDEPREGARHRGPDAGRGLDRDEDGVLETEDLNAIFAELDADSDGTLTAEELPRFRGPRHGHRGGPGGPRGAVLGLLLRTADGDGDGGVTEGEWSEALASADANGDGQIDGEELRALRPERGEGGEGGERPARGDRPGRGGEGHRTLSISVDGLGELFSRLDGDGDGVLTREELPRHRQGGHHGERRGGRPGGSQGGGAA